MDDTLSLNGVWDLVYSDENPDYYAAPEAVQGRRMLEELRDWWKTGRNDIGTPRPNTISPIPEGILLLEGERIARGREPGDGSPQRMVVEQIEKALVTFQK